MPEKRYKADVQGNICDKLIGIPMTNTYLRKIDNSVKCVNDQ